MLFNLNNTTKKRHDVDLHLMDDKDDYTLKINKSRWIKCQKILSFLIPGLGTPFSTIISNKQGLIFCVIFSGH